MVVDNVKALKELKQQVMDLVQSIQKEFGRKCLIVKTGNYGIEARLALWSRTDVLFVSTLKDGLYLTCFEYIYAKYIKKDFKNSALLLSEYTGCSSQFAGFHEFNPFMTKTIVKQLETVIKETPKDKEHNMKRAFKFCHTRTFTGWVENFLKELKLASNPLKIENTRVVYGNWQAVRFAKQKSNGAMERSA